MSCRNLVLSVTATICLVLAGCNTIKGLGTDVHDSAQNVQMWFEESVNSSIQSTKPSPSSTHRQTKQMSRTH